MEYDLVPINSSLALDQLMDTRETVGFYLVGITRDQEEGYQGQVALEWFLPARNYHHKLQVS